MILHTGRPLPLCTGLSFSLFLRLPGGEEPVGGLWSSEPRRGGKEREKASRTIVARRYEEEEEERVVRRRVIVGVSVALAIIPPCSPTVSQAAAGGGGGKRTDVEEDRTLSFSFQSGYTGLFSRVGSCRGLPSSSVVHPVLKRLK